MDETLLQSLDSDRHKQVGSVDSLIDTAFARSELFKAMVLGRSSIVTANDVGDSIGFQQLLLELIAPFENEIAKFNKTAEFPFRPLLIGLEPHHEVTGIGGYHHYVGATRDTAVNLTEARVPLPAFSKIAYYRERSGLNDDVAVLKAMASMLLDGGKAREAVELKRQCPETESFVSLVDRTFSSNELSFFGKASGMTGPQRPDFWSVVQGKAEEGAKDELVADRSQAILRVLHSLAERGVRPKARGDWQRINPEFGENGTIIRDWVDWNLFERVFDTFEIKSRPYITQYCDSEEGENRLRFKLLPDAVPEHTRVNALRSPGELQPGIDVVPWAHFMPLFLSEEFQQSLLRLRRDLVFARNNDGGADRVARTRAAIDRHLQSFSELTDQVRVVRGTDRTVNLIAPANRQSLWLNLTGTVAAGAAGVAALEIAAAPGPLLTFAIESGKFAVPLIAGIQIAKMLRPKRAGLRSLNANLEVDGSTIAWSINRTV